MGVLVGLFARFKGLPSSTKNIIGWCGLAVAVISGTVGFSAANGTPAVPTSAPTAAATAAAHATATASIGGIDFSVILQQYGPLGTIITAIFGASLMVAKEIRDGKLVEVQSYKERAYDAEQRANAEIGKVYQKLEVLEAKLDEVIKDRDNLRDEFTRAQGDFVSEIEELNKRLLREIKARHRAEQLLAEHGIDIPEDDDK